MKLGYRNVDCIVWNVDDVQTGIYLATLNRLGGKDDLNKRINLLRYLSKEIKPANLAKVLLQTETQIKKLLNLKIKLGESGKNAKVFLNSMVFFVTDIQKEKIDRALSSLSEQVKDQKLQKTRLL
jgi:hypothetical protein